MTEKEIALKLFGPCRTTVRSKIAERIEFMAAVQKSLDQLNKGEGIPHDEVKNNEPHGLTN
jgi:hypothetical protein